MEQLQDLTNALKEQRLLGRGLGLIVTQMRLDPLDVPIAEFVPQKLVGGICREIITKFIERGVDLVCGSVEPGSDPAITNVPVALGKWLEFLPCADLHEGETHRVPEL